LTNYLLTHLFFSVVIDLQFEFIVIVVADALKERRSYTNTMLFN